MKARINFDGFGGKIVVQNGEVVIEGGNDFRVVMEEIKSPGVQAIRFSPTSLNLEIEHKDGWILNIRRGIYEKEYLIVTRFKRLKSGTIIWEYLTTGGKWLLWPSGHGPNPSNIMKIPAPTLETVPV
ncbi:MAG: hypothetical protein Q8P91_00025 [bacterium]|nr:hypothetical protein [bacterium]